MSPSIDKIRHFFSPIQYHAPQDKTTLNRATHRLKARLKEERDKSFHDHVAGLTRYDNSVWKPIKHRNKPIQNETVPSPQWVQSDEEKAEHLSKYSHL